MTPADKDAVFYAAVAFIAADLKSGAKIIKYSDGNVPVFSTLHFDRTISEAKTLYERVQEQCK